MQLAKIFFNLGYRILSYKRVGRVVIQEENGLNQTAGFHYITYYSGRDDRCGLGLNVPLKINTLLFIYRFTFKTYNSVISQEIIKRFKVCKMFGYYDLTSYFLE